MGEILDPRLRAQIAAFSGDDAIRREAAPWVDATPEERLAAVWALCEEASLYAANWPAGAAERLREFDRPSPETMALFERLRARPGRG